MSQTSCKSDKNMLQELDEMLKCLPPTGIQTEEGDSNCVNEMDIRDKNTRESCSLTQVINDNNVTNVFRRHTS